MLREIHDGDSGGHFAPRTKTWKIMRVGHYWPDLFKDYYAWCKKCLKCALFAGKEKLPAMPL